MGSVMTRLSLRVMEAQWAATEQNQEQSLPSLLPPGGPATRSHNSTRGSKASSSVPSYSPDPAEGRGLMDPSPSPNTLARCF